MRTLFFIFFSVFTYTLSIAQQEIDTTTNSFFLQPIEIKATRVGDKAPFTKINLNKQTIADQNLGQDLPFLLNQTPSVIINSDAGNGIGYTGIRIRGTDATRINVTLNGIPYNDAESQGVFFVDLPDLASSLNSIQIQRGVGASSNGSGAFGATINLSTNEFNSQPYASSYTTYGSFNTFKQTLKAGMGLLHKHFTMDMRLSTISSDGFIDRATSNLKSFYISTAYIQTKSSLRLNIFSGKEKTYQAWNGIPEARLKGDVQGMKNFATENSYDIADSMHLLKSNNRTYNYFTYKNQTDNYQQNNYQLLYNYKINGSLSFNISSFLTRGLGYYEEYKKDQKLNKYGLSNDTTDIIRQLWLDNYFYGNIFSLQYQKSDNILTIGGGWSKYDGKHYGEIIWSPINIPNEYRWYNGKAYKTDYDVYTKYQYNINKYWSVFADIQYRKVDYIIHGFRNNPSININVNYNFFNPKLGIYYTDKNGLSAYASFSKVSKEPNRDDFEANPKQQPKVEHLYDYELGIEKKYAEASIGATLYYMYYKDQLVLNGKINDVGANTRINVPISYRSGLEIEGTMQFVDWIGASFNTTWSYNKIEGFTHFIDDYDAGMQKAVYIGRTNISLSPQFIGGINLNITPLKHFDFNIVSKYISRQFLDNTGSLNKSIHPYDVEDIKLSYTFLPKFYKSIKIIAQINNIFNKEYEANGYTYSHISGGKTFIDNYYFPMAGTNFLLALNVEW